MKHSTSHVARQRRTPRIVAMASLARSAIAALPLSDGRIRRRRRLAVPASALCAVRVPALSRTAAAALCALAALSATAILAPNAHARYCNPTKFDCPDPPEPPAPPTPTPPAPPTPTPPAPPAPPPHPQLTVSGLGAGRDRTIDPDTQPPTIEWTAHEQPLLTAKGDSTVAAVRLVGSYSTTCRSANGGVEGTQQYELSSDWVAEKTWTAYDASCTAGETLVARTLEMHAEGRSAAGAVVSTGSARFHWTPKQQAVTSVPEGSSGVDAGVTLLPGDHVMIFGGGAIWAGYLFYTQQNNPLGLYYATPVSKKCADVQPGTFRVIDPSACTNPSDYPMPRGAPPFSLIGRTSADWFWIGKGDSFTYNGPQTRLTLRTNDNHPGNGNGSFSADVEVFRGA